MSRDLVAAILTSLANVEQNTRLLFEGQFSGGPVRVWNGVGDLTYESVTWTGLGDLVSVSPSEETTEIGAASLTVGLNGIPSTTIALALGDEYRQRPARLLLAFMSAATTVAGATQVFAGRMDVMSIEDGGETASITVQIENRLADLRRPRTSRYTDEEQQRRFPGDLGLEYTGALAARPIPWGIAPTAAAATGSTGNRGRLDYAQK